MGVEGAAGVLGRVERLGHADGRRIAALGALEGEQVGVDAGDDDRDPLGRAQVAEDLGGPAGARRVEGEDLAARAHQGREAVHPAARLMLPGGASRLSRIRSRSTSRACSSAMRLAR
ncbi:hypothetical protein SHIRM173S_08830 [Streptomyces hirsutus]